MIQIERVVHEFEDPVNERVIRVLDGITLDIEPQTFVSFLGPSGCGKTTLLRIVHGLIAPSKGRVLANGVPVKRPSADRAVVFQDHNLLPWRTALKNVEFGSEILGMSPKLRTAKALEALRLVGLEDFQGHYPHQLSGGMKQRVGLARALCVAPQVLLMDEPFGALDAQTREVMQGELLRIWEADKKMVIFVTHSIDEAIILSDKVVVFSSRPGTIKAVVDIDLPRPRRGRDQDIKSSEAALGYRKQIWELLRPEISDYASPVGD